MWKILHRYFRGVVLGLMLLLAGAANLVCVSYDADNDEDTPPVTVEMNLIAPVKKNTHLPTRYVQAETVRQKDLHAAAAKLATAFSTPFLPLLNTGSLQQDLPLRL
jgi:hypothetical protein